MNRLGASIVLLGFVVLAADSTLAATVLVAVNGEDGSVCGGKTNPCRTLTRAIANAHDGDTILVGPGRYGDVDGNGSLSGPDEEPVNVGCGCLVPVDKPVTLVSRDGAAATVIDAGGTSNALVVISSGGVHFGGKSKGFTLTGTKNVPGSLRVESGGNTITGIVIAGFTGIAAVISGSGNVIASSRVVGGTNDGFQVSGSDNTVTESVATHVPAAGFSLAGSRNALRKVVAIGNSTGIATAGTGHSVTSSVALANAGSGIYVFNGSLSVSKSSIFGNGTLESTNCGLTSDNSTVTATGNFWGAATGPGANPADNVCFSNNGTATTTPFATKEIKVAPKAVR